MSEESSRTSPGFEKFTPQDLVWGIFGGLSGTLTGAVADAYVSSSSNTQNQAVTLHYQQQEQHIATLQSQVGGLETLQTDTHPFSASPHINTLIGQAVARDVTHKYKQIQNIESSMLQPKPAGDSKGGEELGIFFGAVALGIIGGVLLSCGKRFITDHQTRRRGIKEFYTKMQADEHVRHLEAQYKLKQD